MYIIHFDCDKYIKPHLQNACVDEPLQKASGDMVQKAQIVSIKTASTASKEVLEKFSSLKLLITRTVGTDHIDLDYCKERGITVRNIPDYGSYNIAEHVFALLLAGSRNIISCQQEIRRGHFSHSHHMAYALRGKTMGIVGTGKIGLETARLARAFGMKLLAYDVYQNEAASKEIGFEYVSLKQLAEAADAISLHAPLLESTYHLINEEILHTMKAGSVLINTARGGLIDTQALLRHIGKFRFVGLDVLEDEAAFSANHPLLKCENVIITPHSAFFSDESVKSIGTQTMEMIEEFDPEGMRN